MADERPDPRRVPGWKRDPWKRHAGRYWDGAQWTEHVVSADKEVSTDPVPDYAPTPPIYAPSEPPTPVAQSRPIPPLRPSRRRRGPGWRKMTWVVIVFNVLCLIWLIGGVASVANSNSCATQTDISESACRAAANAGAGIGAAIIVFVWVAGDVILGVIWLVTRPKDRRACPVCGTEVKTGLVVCPSCGYDYRAAVAR